jgi:hypothetical protein
MTASTSRVVFVPPAMVPFALPRPGDGIECRPEIGDELLLQYALQKRSIRCMSELTVRQARELLAGWAAERHTVAGRRDELVRAAVEAGLSKAEVHRLTGIARTTIDRIVVTAAAAGDGGAE